MSSGGSGEFCSVCGCEMRFVRHGVGCARLMLACCRVKLHDKVIDGVDYRGLGVFRVVSDDWFRARFSNVFELWLEGGGILPFKVRRLSWAAGTYYVVRKIVVSEKDWDVFRSSGRLYGEAFGCCLYEQKRNCACYIACSLRLSKMSNAGRYEWVRV